MGGRKPKLSKRDESSIIKALHYARKQDGKFTSKRIKLCSGISSVHDRIVRRVLDNLKRLENAHEICKRHKKVL